jgi:hypothetical protein
LHQERRFGTRVRREKIGLGKLVPFDAGGLDKPVYMQGLELSVDGAWDEADPSAR